MPKDAVNVLPAVASGYLTHFDSHIERTAEEVETITREGSLPRPHWDPTLVKSRVEKMKLLRHLFDLKLVSARRRVKSRVGLFFVKKKDGMIRLICDSRVPNALHQRPPKTRLGGPDSLIEIDLSDETLRDVGGFGEIFSGELCAGTLDVKDSFFQYSVKEVASWFGLGERIRAQDWGIETIWDDDAQGMTVVKPDEELELVMEAMSMGWTWALYLCNEGTAALAREGDVCSLIRDKECVPTLTPQRPLSAAYVGNLNTLAATTAGA